MIMELEMVLITILEGLADHNFKRNYSSNKIKICSYKTLMILLLDTQMIGINLKFRFKLLFLKVLI